MVTIDELRESTSAVFHEHLIGLWLLAGQPGVASSDPRAEVLRLHFRKDVFPLLLVDVGWLVRAGCLASCFWHGRCLGLLVLLVGLLDLLLGCLSRASVSRWAARLSAISGFGGRRTLCQPGAVAIHDFPGFASLGDDWIIVLRLLRR